MQAWIVAASIVGFAVVVFAMSPSIHAFFWNVGTSWLSSGNSSTPFDQQLFVLSGESPASPDFFDQIAHGWRISTSIEFWGAWFTASLFISLILITGIVYCTVRLLQIRRIERIAMQHAASPVSSGDVPRIQLRWRRILEQLESDDQQKWRLAILEADIMLNELLDVQGYKGETMEDKMKKVDIAAFNTIDFAWEAHKVRNRIVKEGAAFPLEAREAKRVIRMYERVLREFKFVE